MGQGILGVVTGFYLWAFLWWGLNALLPAIFPKMFHPNGTTDNLILNLVIILLSFDFAFFSGFINAIIAKHHQMRFAFIQGLLQFAAAVYLQRAHWDLMPLWFQLSFLALILPGVLGGAKYQMVYKKEEPTEI